MEEERLQQVSTQDQKALLIHNYRRILSFNFISTIIVLLVIGSPFLLTFLLSRFRENPSVNFSDIPFLLVVGLLGSLGAFFSALIRLNNIEDLKTVLSNSDIGEIGNWYLLMYSLLRPLTGFMAAILFYLLVMSNLISGDFLPKFVCHQSECGTLSSIGKLGPDQAQDYIKALVWGFISGFSERLVPDALSKLESKIDQ